MSYRMNVDQYQRLVEAAVLDGQSVELINGLLVRKMGKTPPHVIACEATRDQLLPLIPRGWRLTIEAPVRIPDYDEPEPDLAVVRGTREEYEHRHPGPDDIEILIEVADTTLDRDRGEKQLAYARARVPAYWIVNLVDRRLEIYTSPTPTGYREKCLLGPDDQVAVMIGGEEVGRFAFAAILPRGGAAGGTDAAKNP
jgi:Uma2 family endonuclease